MKNIESHSMIATVQKFVAAASRMEASISSFSARLMTSSIIWTGSASTVAKRCNEEIAAVMLTMDDFVDAFDDWTLNLQFLGQIEGGPGCEDALSHSDHGFLDVLQLLSASQSQTDSSIST